MLNLNNGSTTKSSALRFDATSAATSFCLRQAGE